MYSEFESFFAGLCQGRHMALLPCSASLIRASLAQRKSNDALTASVRTASVRIAAGIVPDRSPRPTCLPCEPSPAVVAPPTYRETRETLGTGLGEPRRRNLVKEHRDLAQEGGSPRSLRRPGAAAKIRTRTLLSPLVSRARLPARRPPPSPPLCHTFLRTSRPSQKLDTIDGASCVAARPPERSLAGPSRAK